jgi:hypothetical protein
LTGNDALTAEYVGLTRRRDHGTQIFLNIVGELLQKRRKRQRTVEADHHRVAVGCRFRDFGGCHRAAGGGLVFDDDRLRETHRQLFRDRASEHVERAPGGRRHDEFDRTVGPRLRGRGKGNGARRQRSECAQCVSAHHGLKSPYSGA